MRNEQLIIIDDNTENLRSMKDAILDMGFTQEVIGFHNATVALDYLRKSIPIPLVIICIMNSVNLSGFALRAAILGMEDCPAKLAPFVFFSTSHTWEDIGMAEQLQANAVFKRATNEAELKSTLHTVFGMLFSGNTTQYVA